MAYLFAIVLPPSAVWWASGFGLALLNAILTLCFYVPGAIHALFVVHKRCQMIDKEINSGRKSTDGKSKKLTFDRNEYADQELENDNQDTKELFVNTVKPSLDKNFDNSSIENSKFVNFVSKYLGEKPKLGPKLNYRTKINVSDLYKDYMSWARFNIEKEIPLIYKRPSVTDQSGILITNKYVYYTLYRSSSFIGIEQTIDKIPLAIIDKISLISKQMGLYAEIDINGTMIGALGVEDKKYGLLLESLLSEMVARSSDFFEKKIADCSGAAPQVDNIEKIKQLNRLKEDGILSQEEFEEKKKELLANL